MKRSKPKIDIGTVVTYKRSGQHLVTSIDEDCVYYHDDEFDFIDSIVFEYNADFGVVVDIEDGELT